MLNFGASKPRVRGRGPGPWGPPPGSAPAFRRKNEFAKAYGAVMSTLTVTQNSSLSPSTQ